VSRNLKRRDLKKRRMARSRGATLFEAAMMMMVFLTLVFGICGFGHALYVYHALNNAAKEGARWAAVNGYLCNNDSSCTFANGAQASDIQTFVQNSFPASIDPSKATVTASFTAPSGAPPVCTSDILNGSGTVIQAKEANYPGCTVKVKIEYTYTFLFPLISNNTLNMSTTSEMVIAH